MERSVSATPGVLRTMIRATVRSETNGKQIEVMRLTGSSTPYHHQPNWTLGGKVRKACLPLLAALCAGIMGIFANAQAPGEHILSAEGESTDRTFPPTLRPMVWNTHNDPQKLPEPTDSFFFIACMAFAGLTSLYYRSNERDEYQKPILVSGAMVGLLAALSLDLGILLGIFALEPWVVLLSLVVSDCFHRAVLRRPLQAVCKTHTINNEKP
jgi:hypothetical protein